VVSRSREPAPEPAPEPATATAVAALHDRLGYLLKHLHLAFSEVHGAALAELQVNGRELAVLVVLGGPDPLSQQDAAGRLGVDRTTMVDLVDGLEQKGLVERRPDATDRRRNIVTLTTEGRRVLRDGSQASATAEQQFLSALNPAEANQFRATLQRLLTHPNPLP
jgi:DNA-binding MarR family transcriptional regulator